MTTTNKILLATLALASPLPASAQTAQPNIIYILADDLGYGDLGCYGQTKIETPNIDQLAAKGMRFTQYYAGTAVCAPSRCITLTGLHSGHAYIRGNDEMPERGDVWNHAAMLADPRLEGQRPLPAGTITYPLLLQKAGYITACVGKWGLGYPGSDATPNKMGFDFFYGYNCQRQAHTYYPPFLYRNEQREYLPNKLLPPGAKLDKNADPLDEKNYAKFTQKAYSPDLMYAEILNFIAQNKNKPFYLHWTTTIPHVALQAPARWVKHYTEKFGPEKPYTAEKGGYYPCRYPRATYAAMISYLDEQIGGLVAKLKQLGIYENTIIIFTSDNGPASSGGSDPAWFNSAALFGNNPRHMKGTLNEGGIRVPMIAAWEGTIKPNTQSAHPCASWDIMPTLCELAKAPPPPACDGISFAPELLGKKQKQHDYLYWEYPDGGGSKAIRVGKWKGLILDIRQKGEAAMRLYDLEADPREQNDLSPAHPDIIKTMREYMAQAHEEPEIKRFSMIAGKQPGEEKKKAQAAKK